MEYMKIINTTHKFTHEGYMLKVDTDLDNNTMCIFAGMEDDEDYSFVSEWDKMGLCELINILESIEAQLL